MFEVTDISNTPFYTNTTIAAVAPNAAYVKTTTNVNNVLIYILMIFLQIVAAVTIFQSVIKYTESLERLEEKKRRKEKGGDTKKGGDTEKGGDKKKVEEKETDGDTEKGVKPTPENEED